MFRQEHINFQKAFVLFLAASHHLKGFGQKNCGPKHWILKIKGKLISAGQNLLTYRQSQHNKTLYKLKCFAGGDNLLMWALTNKFKILIFQLRQYNTGREKVTGAYLKK